MPASPISDRDLRIKWENAWKVPGSLLSALYTPCSPYPSRPSISDLIKIRCALAGRLSSLEHCPMHQKVEDSISGQGTYLDVGSILSWSVDGRRPIDICLSHQCVCLSLLPSSLKSIKHILMWGIYIYDMNPVPSNNYHWPGTIRSGTYVLSLSFNNLRSHYLNTSLSSKDTETHID